MSDASDDDTPVAEHVLRSGDSAKDKMFAPKKTPKAIRVLTVLAYMLSVSLAAIMLSLYYVFLWDPKVPGAMRRMAEPAGPPPCQPITSQAYMQTKPYSNIQTMVTPSASVSPVIQYLTRAKTTTQPAVNTTEYFTSTTRSLQGT